MFRLVRNNCRWVYSGNYEHHGSNSLVRICNGASYKLSRDVVDAFWVYLHVTVSDAYSHRCHDFLRYLRMRRQDSHDFRRNDRKWKWHCGAGERQLPLDPRVQLQVWILLSHCEDVFCSEAWRCKKRTEATEGRRWVMSLLSFSFSLC